MDKKEGELYLIDENNISTQNIHREEVTIEDLHKDLEKKLEEQGLIFDKRKFILTEEHLTFGDRISDTIARFGGSWHFLLVFLFFVFSWLGLNVYLFYTKPFDPYPYQLLNLVLACVASIQAPIIMMSQNRQIQRDKKQEEINIEKDFVDFKQDHLDLILDQKEWEILKGMDQRLRRIETLLAARSTAQINKRPLMRALRQNKSRKVKA
jgi:uncharacterized membrane protein